MTGDAPSQTENSPRQLWLTLVAMALAGSTVIVLLGAVASWLLVRRVPGMIGPVFGRRSRWVVATAGGTTPGLTRLPPAAIEPDPPPD